MSIRSFLKLVEIQTKIASIIPFTLGTLYAYYRFDNFNFTNFSIMLISVLAFDMVTTAINNYYDYKNAIKTYGYNYESHNAIVRYDLKESTVIATILTLLGIATIFGILLVFKTNIIVLIIGMLSFAIGILYSFGPIPINRTPFGELFSGLFMGFIIVFLSVYIHIYDKNILTFIYNKGLINISINFFEILYIFLISIPTINGIADIMLANNICDIEDDIENRRYTLPIYLGKEKALMLFKIIYYIIYIDFIALFLLGIFPSVSLLTLLTFIPVNKNINVFFQKQTKRDTFVISIKNFVLISLSYILIIGISIVLK
ncbi:1,4-dihydroxy-2-naphthoate polyprenyltransferase [Thermohalobacter berrensis]|uniref:1,4-dihydroxy-2-naphthoate polyprenyltransferase n=1 Tax=Thermohalobacter berrensis TaxID=99594 RepID=A0A419SW87_9FIRM|nr:1,4-dihydroxy-2-naphthoate polyprenyltransferase [Thermohalobacter berrensis]RKD29494.1 1,4-dihydroxy-2-naphthoate polyprenyltransferase [Thermohalobacter berrensis]